jgi:hypothetical protein
MKTPMWDSRSTAPRRLLAAVGAVVVVGLAACDRSPTASEDDHGEPVAAQVFARASGELLAYTHGTGAGLHWDGSIPTLEVGEEIALNVVFLDDEDRPIPLGGEFEVRARLATGAPSGIVELSDHGDHIDVEAVNPGQTRIVFMLWHGGHSDWDSPGLTINVGVGARSP